MHPSLVELANEPMPVAPAPIVVEAAAPVEEPPQPVVEEHEETFSPVVQTPAPVVETPAPVAIETPAFVRVEEPAPPAVEEPAVEEPAADAFSFHEVPLNEPIHEISFREALAELPDADMPPLDLTEEDLELEPGAGPDPTTLLVISRLERFLGAIQHARSTANL